ncbi:YidC/Oxa1 family membrane protein insertase [Rhizobium ruizarguesonis]
MDFVQTALSPISAAMAAILEAFYSLTSNYGISIILLSIAVRLLLLPLSRWAQRIERGEAETQAAMRADINEAKATLKGRERFERIDEIYTAHSYHPIYSLKSLSALALQIPFLLAALFLLTDYPPIEGYSFGPIADLSKPDGMVSAGALSINLVPIALTSIAIGEAFLDDRATTNSRIKFIFVAVIVFMLIYNFPASISLYWLVSNTISLLLMLSRR